VGVYKSEVVTGSFDILLMIEMIGAYLSIHS
jgi:hypothetical protein